MELASNSSDKKLSILKPKNPNQRTIDEVMREIRNAIENTHWVQTRLSQLEAIGYQIEDCWVKNGCIEDIRYLPRKKAIRIQVAESEPRGDYHKAKCVIIPATDILFQQGDSTRVWKLPLKFNPEIDESIKQFGNNSKNKKR